MHSRMLVLKDPNEAYAAIDGVIDACWEHKDANLEIAYGIDYFREIYPDAGLPVLQHNYPEGFNQEIVNNVITVTITFEAVVNWFQEIIKDINTFMFEHKPVNDFVQNMYGVSSILNPEHPKIMTTYAYGCQDILQFSRSLYDKMYQKRLDHINYELYKCYDYHF